MGVSIFPRNTIEYKSKRRAARRNKASRVKNPLFILMVPGLYQRIPAFIMASMNKLLPTSTAIPISIPSRSPPYAAVSEAKRSGAPPPIAIRVTPAKLSDSRNVFEISCRDGERNSSAVKLNRKKATAKVISYTKKNNKDH